MGEADGERVGSWGDGAGEVTGSGTGLETGDAVSDLGAVALTGFFLRLDVDEKYQNPMPKATSTPNKIQIQV